MTKLPRAQALLLGLALVARARGARGRQGDDRHGRLASANLWPVFIGINKGFFAAENLKLDLVFVQSSANLVQQLAAGSLDITHVDRPGRSDPRHRPGRADRDRALRGAGAALCAAGQVEHQEVRRSSRARPSRSAVRRTSPGSTSSACWRRTASSQASSTWCSPARPRRAPRRCRPARSMPRSCCRRSISTPTPPASTISA